MPDRIFTILARLRQDLAGCLTADAIENACRSANHPWRRRALGPVSTVYLFLLQVLHGNTACQHLVHFGGWRFTDSAYCQARKRLPLAVLHALLERTAAVFRAATNDAGRWLGHRVWVIDGSGFSMPDTPELQRHFGQPSNQAPGCGFPVARWMALFDVATGMLLKSAAAPLRSHDMALAGDASEGLEAGDVVLGDRGFCSYAHVAMLAARGLHAVFRMHQRRIVDFTPGRAGADTRPRRGRAGLPRSRWVAARGGEDHVVIWSKPERRPSWISEGRYEALPGEVVVRELRYRVEAPGFRTHEVILMTTLLSADDYPPSTLADLYLRRWRVELNFRHIKITMKMDVLRCRTVEGVLKELAVFALAYNLVRAAMVESARARGVGPDRISLVDALRWLIGDGAEGEAVLRVNPSRPGRFEPRVRKRRPKQYPLMNRPRAELRNQLTGNGVAG